MISLLLGLAVAYSVWQNPYSDGAQMVYVGAMLNAVALVSNGFQMPVFDQNLTPKKLRKVDFLNRHKIGNEQANFKILCDWINFGFMNASPGDLIMFLGAFYNFTGLNLASNGQNITIKYEYCF